jgi:ribosome-associated translation inhibitor RaiA
MTMTTTMKLNLQHLNLRALDAVDAWIERQLSPLARLRQIDVANVRLVRLANASPAYQVNVHLVTPGPDVFAESRDHTLRAAFAKVMAQLREKLTLRAAKRLQRIKSNLSARAVKTRGARPA